jgi:predicted TIM-barrel enzyme
MARAGADIIVAHMGVTTGGSIGATSAKTLDRCITEIDASAAAAGSVRRDILLLCHGGPIAMPDDDAYVLARADGLHGFYGASSAKRLPAEWAIAEQILAFKALQIPSSVADQRLADHRWKRPFQIPRRCRGLRV